MRASKNILDKIKNEKGVHGDLRANLLLAEGELKKAEQVRGKTSYAALSKDDEKSKRALESAEETIVKSSQRIVSFKAAITESEKRLTELETEYNAALEGERWETYVVKPLRDEITGNAVQIDRHFAGSSSVEKLDPFVSVVTNHSSTLAAINGELTRRNMEHSNLVVLFKRWLDVKLHPIFKDSARAFYSKETREELERSYVEFLTKRTEVIFKKRETAAKLAVNE